ncbi:hypothetical protein TMatcc_005619 [Talaromyces marneffei ATCC 18224]|uniref:Oxo-4-hydroxy-4-carboxy-5-ureidoimidazoline decarboxylase domain-containing protein n=2 Tax=Talaromyces marneffei TaxID=37727 RepID=B6Q9P6_TALMQ|nr:uncharacterized protein EYB26_005862 [Talaromyces marneffei]EEA26130.1 conserved hypothetical protein [Talaromyces marneffei ATCC 18224]KAE8554837.1 hypothetical protein EYB25_003384 [Talaromyces marneffei]QGA18178.1 hypothetical protein EYB26_005862 [Talaromyces marneffei]
MAVPTLPSITSLPTLPLSDQLKAIDTLFEPSPELHNLLQPILSNAQTFSSYDSLIDEIYNKLSTLSATNDPQQKHTLYGILGSHPRLGATSPTAQAGLSELSRREQANINKSTDERAAADQAARLAALNREYEEKYPGLRYVTWVNGRGRDVIMVDMRRRIDRGEFELEVRDNIQAMCDIAKDRAKKLQANL